MEARILNAVLNVPRFTKHCDPEIRIFDWPDDTHIAFDPNSLCAVQIGADVARRLKETTGFRGLLYSTIAPTYPCPTTAPVRKVVLNVTHNCNLACKYCFAAGYVQQPPMPLETALKALELFEPEQAIDIAFFGGEPLLEWGLMTAVAERALLLARKRHVACKLHVTTNGTLIDQFKATALKRYGFSVLVSLDGPEDIHNASRPAKKGNSWKQTIEGLTQLKAAGMGARVMIRATFAESKPRLVDRLKFFADLHDRGFIVGSSIEPAILSEGCGATPTAKADRQTLAREWHEAAEWYVRRIKSGKPFSFFYFRKIGERILNCQHMGNECGAGRSYLTVGPDGKLYACHREEGTEIGDIDTGFDAVKRLPWWTTRLEMHAECQKCWARNICGGGCPQARIAIGGHINAITPELCAAKKTIFKQAFWILSKLTSEEARRVMGNERTCKVPARNASRM